MSDRELLELAAKANRPEALQLADELTEISKDPWAKYWERGLKAAAELRRLHALNGGLLEALEYHTAQTRTLADVCVSASPRREWRGLTEEEIDDMSLGGTDSELRRQQFARAIEAALKERNT